MPRPSKLISFADKIGILHDAVVAELAGTTTGNVRIYRKRHGIPARFRGEGTPRPNEQAILEEHGAPAIPAPRPKRSRRRRAAAKPGASATPRKPRKSKLDPYLDQVGVLPDREVAQIAGVTAENVRAYRNRRGIPAGWRKQAAAAPAPAPVVSAAPKARKPRRGKLTPYLERIGILTDSRIAALASTTAQNVRAYRLRHGIPARWRGEGEPLPNEAAILALEVGPPAEPAAPAGPAVSPTKDLPPEPDDLVDAGSPAPMLEGFEIMVRGPEGEVTYFGLGADIVDAGAKAVADLGTRMLDGKVVAIKFLGKVLGR